MSLESRNALELFPPEIWEQIGAYLLQRQDVSRFAQVSHALHHIVMNSRVIWENCLQREMRINDGGLRMLTVYRLYPPVSDPRDARIDLRRMLSLNDQQIYG